jgi:hypothetical protein
LGCLEKLLVVLSPTHHGSEGSSSLLCTHAEKVCFINKILIQALGSSIISV